MLGLALGVAAGAAAGLLAAPMRGNELRANLRSRAEDANRSLQTYAASTRAWTQQTLDRGRRSLDAVRQSLQSSSAPAPLTARVGEIVASHDNARPSTWGAQS